MRVIKIDDNTDKKRLLDKIGSTKEGTKIMRDKMDLHLFYIKDMKTPAANILKQDALSIGAELAVEKDTILCKDEYIDGVLIVTEKQRKILAKKEKAQPFGLKSLAQNLEMYRVRKDHKVEIMGVINANSDSFFQRNRFQGAKAIYAIEKMIEQGASIIDIGGVSSRPGSLAVSGEEELARIQPVVDAIFTQKLYEKVQFSIDSYAPKPIAYALQKGFGMVNDITGLENDEVCRLCAEYDAKVVIMHMQKKPVSMQENPTYDHVITDVEDFFVQRMKKAEDFGIKDIVLDVGVGFGKSLEHNLLLIKHMDHFQKLGVPLLVGASRKSLIDKIIPTAVEDRLPGTLVLHLKAIEQGASIVRCHDVSEHYQALKVYESLRETLV